MSGKEVIMTQEPRKVADDLTEYWRTYNQQACVDKYTSITLINDALYGLGIALNPELYRTAVGYEEFKKVLRKHLAT